MPEKLELIAQQDTPEVLLDKQNGIFSFKGKSLPEDVCEFYAPIKKWFKEYCENPNEHTEIICKFDYFNSATSRKLVELFTTLECLKGKNAKVLWYHKQEDSIIIDKGQELDYLIDLPFEFALMD